MIDGARSPYILKRLHYTDETTPCKVKSQNKRFTSYDILSNLHIIKTKSLHIIKKLRHKMKNPHKSMVVFFFVLRPRAGMFSCYWVEKNTQKYFRKSLFGLVSEICFIYIQKIISDLKISMFYRYMVCQNRFIAKIDFNFYELV